MPCHHTWHQKGKDVVSVVNGVETTRFTHECPACGKIKVTVRASRKLPPDVKWKRELEKLFERAAAENYRFLHDGVPLVLSRITIDENGRTNVLRSAPGTADSANQDRPENSGGPVSPVQP